jgi:hypothetical protein
LGIFGNGGLKWSWIWKAANKKKQDFGREYGKLTEDWQWNFQARDLNENLVKKFPGRILLITSK